MYRFLSALFPLNRSLTGDAVRQTLRHIQQVLPELAIIDVPTGTAAFDWVVPDEWNLREAFVIDPDGNRILDSSRNNLHVVGYSEPVDCLLTKEQLNQHLHSLPDQPEAIPYVTSYYKRQWGFCLKHSDRERLPEGRYRVRIDATLQPGALSYGEAILPGREDGEVLLSCYVCHPSMANDSLSGVSVAAYLGEWLRQLDRRYTYRLVFVPETLGAIVYLSRNLERMKQRTIAGFVLTCCGDERTYSFVPSRLGNTLADRVAKYVLLRNADPCIYYSWLDRGSDERQYCSPGVDLPVASIMRSKYREFPEYHTSLDNLCLVTPHGLEGTYTVLKECLSIIESNGSYRTLVTCEPQLGKRGLYPTLSVKGSARSASGMLDVLSFCDGAHDLLQIAEQTALPFASCLDVVSHLQRAGLVARVSSTN